MSYLAEKTDYEGVEMGEHEEDKKCQHPKRVCYSRNSAVQFWKCLECGNTWSVSLK